MKLILENWRKYIKENIDLDIKVGDVLLGGKYRNKRVGLSTDMDVFQYRN